ncbi:MAG: ATP-binding cassette domain-containing protein [Cyanobacteria bacterium P01_F01_bin.3]
MSLLTFDRVTMTATIGVIEILKDLTLSVTQGDFVALVGPSGAGKTSLLRLMNRLVDASNGQILFEGQDIRQLSAVSLRQQVVLVNQESRLLGMTVREALGYPLRLKHREPGIIRPHLGCPCTSLWGNHICPVSILEFEFI